MTGHVAANRKGIEPGTVIGKWTVLGRDETKGRKNGRVVRSYYRCRCACGTEKPVEAYALRNGLSPSCGCVTRARGVGGEAHASFKHGLITTPTYRSWASMLARCTNKNSPNYVRYGGRGIQVCERWSTFTNFLADMGERPVDRSLDRIDNMGNYEPSNCRWATASEQAYNRRKKGASNEPPGSAPTGPS